jgi:hypothetical protein
MMGKIAYHKERLYSLKIKLSTLKREDPMEGELHGKLDSLKAHWRNKAQTFVILEEGMWFSKLRVHVVQSG